MAVSEETQPGGVLMPYDGPITACRSFNRKRSSCSLSLRTMKPVDLPSMGPTAPYPKPVTSWKTDGQAPTTRPLIPRSGVRVPEAGNSARLLTTPIFSMSCVTFYTRFLHLTGRSQAGTSLYPSIRCLPWSGFYPSFLCNVGVNTAMLPWQLLIYKKC